MLVFFIVALFVIFLFILYSFLPSVVGAVFFVGLFALISSFAGENNKPVKKGENEKGKKAEQLSSVSLPDSERETQSSTDLTPSSGVIPTIGSLKTGEGVSKTIQTGKYMDAAGVSPGARAMAAALQARSRSIKKELVVLYGSQTGNATEIAKTISSEATSKGLLSNVLALNDLPLSKLASVSAAIFVVSSTGDGDPPENCVNFFNSLRRRTLPPDMLSSLQYTVLGLGDSNYTQYMKVPRVFTSRLQELGGKCFYPCCEADEVEGLEEAVDRWQAGLWVPLKSAISQSLGAQSAAPPVSVGVAAEEEGLVGVPALNPCKLEVIWLDQQEADDVVDPDWLSAPASGGFSPSRPYPAPVTSAEYLTADWSDRVVIHLQLDVAAAHLSARPGDSIGVLPENNPAMVEALLARLTADGNRVFRVQGTPIPAHLPGSATSFARILTRHLDITTAPRKSLLRTLAECCSEPQERVSLLRLSSRGGREEYKARVQEPRLNLLELLNLFPSCLPGVAALLDALPPLMPRHYSVSNDPATAGRLEVAFSVVREALPGGGVFRGVASNWLDRILDMQKQRKFEFKSEGSLRVPLFLKSGGDFHPPDDLASPLLMIGPGTGVAPFRGFLQERRTRLGEGEIGGQSWLFFGCRKEDEDFLYQEDLQGFVKDGTLQHLEVAFSRAQQDKVYVQHRLKEKGEGVAALLLHPKAHVYVCGDGVNMAKDVHSALLAILAEHAGLGEGLGVAHMNTMVAEKRYLRDIWS